MAAIVTAKCSACGSLHRFFLPYADMFDGRAAYAFVCPSTGEPGRMSTTAWNEVVPYRPVDAVEVERIQE